MSETEKKGETAESGATSADAVTRESGDPGTNEVPSRDSALEVEALSEDAELELNQSGLSDLVAQQLKQMLEEGGQNIATASGSSFSGTHKMQLHVKTGPVDMQLETNTESNQEPVELQAQLKLLRKIMQETIERLEIANQRIGYLEAELERKNTP